MELPITFKIIYFNTNLNYWEVGEGATIKTAKEVINFIKMEILSELLQEVLDSRYSSELPLITLKAKTGFMYIDMDGVDLINGNLSHCMYYQSSSLYKHNESLARIRVNIIQKLNHLRFLV